MFRGQTQGCSPRVCFEISRGIQILPRGNFFQISPKAFPLSVRLWFSRGARIYPKGPLWKNLGKPAVRSVHSKSQIALIENQSLFLFVNSLLREAAQPPGLARPAAASAHPGRCLPLPHQTQPTAAAMSAARDVCSPRWLIKDSHNICVSIHTCWNCSLLG